MTFFIGTASRIHRRSSLKTVMEGKGGMLASTIFNELKDKKTPWQPLSRGARASTDRGLVRQLAEYLKNMKEVELINRNTRGGRRPYHYKWKQCCGGLGIR